MDKSTALLLLCAASLVAGQDLELGIYGQATREVRVGSSVQLTCHLNRGLDVILHYKVQWVHVSAYGGEPTETVLTEQQTLQESASPNNYSVSFSYEGSMSNITLNVLRVKDVNDGKFVCRAIPLSDESSSDVPMQEVNMIVLSGVSAVHLEFDNEGPVMGESSVPVEREEGTFPVTCTAKGFNPSATLRLFVGDDEVAAESSAVSDSQMSGQARARRYMTTLTRQVELMAAHSDKTISCQAQAPSDASPRTASLPLQIIALEPVITCDDNVTARVGDMHIDITCHVDHTSVNVDYYSWEIGDSGEVITLGEMTSDNDDMSVTEVDEHNTDVTLSLYKTEEWHFDSIYYLDVYLVGGQKFRVKATIIKLDSTSGSGKPTVFVLGLLLPLIVSL